VPVLYYKILGASGGAERLSDTPVRDSQDAYVMVDRKPVMEFPIPVTRQSTNTPKIWNTQVKSSDRFFIDRAQQYTLSDSYMLCNPKPVAADEKKKAILSDGMFYGEGDNGVGPQPMVGFKGTSTSYRV
jgi:hypothetical protein